VGEPQPGADEVKIKVEHNGICGTDLHDTTTGRFSSDRSHPLTGAHFTDSRARVLGTVVEVGKAFRESVKATGCVSSRSTVVVSVRAAKPATTTFARQSLFTASCHTAAGCRVHRRALADCSHVARLRLSRARGPVEPCRSVTTLPARGTPRGRKRGRHGRRPIGIGTYLALLGQGITDVTVIEPSLERREAIQSSARLRDRSTGDQSRRVRQRAHGGVGAAAVFEAAGVPASLGAAVEMVGPSIAW